MEIRWISDSEILSNRVFGLYGLGHWEFMLAFRAFHAATLDKGWASRTSHGSSVADVESETAFWTANQSPALGQPFPLLHKAHMEETNAVLKAFVPIRQPPEKLK